MKRYEPVEHTADVGIKAYGQDLPELFCNAAWGMFDTIADVKNFKAERCFNIKLEAENQEELLVAWLRELLYHYISKACLGMKFDIKELSETNLKAEAWCAQINDRSQIKKDIKAVTYHDLHILKKGNLYETQIIFDV